MIKQLSNSVIAKYCDLSMSRRSIICLSLRLRQIIDLLATDKSQYFAQPRPIIVNYLSVILDFWWWKFFRNSISVCISPGCSGIICTNMFYMSVNKRLRGELVEAMVNYKLYISYVLAK